MPEQLPNIEPVAIALQTGRDETPRVDSRELAQRLGVKHKNTIELLDKHKAAYARIKQAVQPLHSLAKPQLSISVQ